MRISGNIHVNIHVIKCLIDCKVFSQVFISLLCPLKNNSKTCTISVAGTKPVMIISDSRVHLSYSIFVSEKQHLRFESALMNNFPRIFSYKEINLETP